MTHNTGFEKIEYMFNRGHYKKVQQNSTGDIKFLPTAEIGDEKSYLTDWITDKSIEFIENRSYDRPFCLVASIPDPHPPYPSRKPYDTMFSPREMPIPASFRQDKSNLPKWASKTMITSEQELQKHKAAYLGSVKCIDDNVGRILSTLEDNGIKNNTIIIFTTDHGEFMGEHGLMNKTVLFESAFRIPFVISWPGHIKPNTEINNIITSVDFLPTISSLVKNDVADETLQGNDASKLFRGETTNWHDYAFLYHPSFRFGGIVSDSYFLAIGKSDGMLFDRRSDKDQVENIYHQPKYKKLIYNLRRQWKKHNRVTSSPYKKWV